jgi:hypothetical protein
MMADTPTFEIEGLNKLLRALEKLDDAAKESFKEAGHRVGKFVAAKARDEAPVLSGRLQGTVRPVNTGRGAKIRAGGTRVPYAGPIHFGWRSRNIRPNQFMYRAVDKSVDEAVEMYLAEVYKIWNRNV